MTIKLVAVALTEDGTVSSHAGRALSWNVYAIENSQPELIWKFQFTEPGGLHEWHVRGDGNRHPLHGVDVALAGTSGEGVTRRLAERNTQLVTTTEQDPLTAVAKYLAGNLADVV